MNFKKIKLEFFYLRKAFFEYRHGLAYIYRRWVAAPKILTTRAILEKPVTALNLSIHILTCHRDLVMLVWSLSSFYQNATVIGKLYIHDDGSLTIENTALLRRFFPSATIISTKTFLADYADQLQFWPVIAEMRAKPQYFLLKKLIDQFFVSATEFRLVIDSDLLWFQKPSVIETAIASAGPTPLMMTNASPAWVYFNGGRPIDDHTASFNSGIVLYRKDQFNLEKLNQYLSDIDQADSRNNHFIEQAGFAVCLDGVGGLPLENYHIKNAVSANTVVKHYTSPRRPLFYIEGLARGDIKALGRKK